MKRSSRARTRPVRCAALAATALLAAGSARASFLSGDALDTAADVMSWVVLFLVPVIGIVLFWLVHVLPERIAEKRHHPQTAAIQTLCLLSLVFGGLLWPIAWLWAYTKPVMHKLAYGTDKHEAFFEEGSAKLSAGELVEHEIAQLKTELDAMRARGPLSPELARLHDDLAALQPAGAQPVAATAQPVPAAAKSDPAAQPQRRST